MKSKSKKKNILILVGVVILLIGGYALWRTQIATPVFIFETQTNEPAQLFINGKKYGTTPVTLSYDNIASLLEENSQTQFDTDNVTIRSEAHDIFTSYRWQFTGSRLPLENGNGVTNILTGTLNSHKSEHSGFLRIEIVGADGKYKKISGVSGSAGLGRPCQQFLF